MSAPTTVVEQLRAIKALAERGVGGEAVNAKAMLEKLLVKYDLTLAALDVVHRKERSFTWRMKQDKDLLFQCVWKCCQDWNGDYSYKGSYIYIPMTDAEYVDVRELYSYYTDAWRKELDALMTAFVHKHKLFSCKPKESTGPGMSPEEYEKLMTMMKGLTQPSMVTKSHQIEKK